eukprot:334866_1
MATASVQEDSYFSDFIEDLLINICTFLDLKSLHTFQVCSKATCNITKRPASYHSKEFVVDHNLLTQYRIHPISLSRYCFTEKLSIEQSLFVADNDTGKIFKHIMNQFEMYFKRLRHLIIYGTVAYAIITQVTNRQIKWQFLLQIENLVLEDCGLLIYQRVTKLCAHMPMLKDLSVTGEKCTLHMRTDSIIEPLPFNHRLTALTLTPGHLDIRCLPLLLNLNVRRLYLYWHENIVQSDIIQNMTELRMLTELVLCIVIKPATNIELLMNLIERFDLHSLRKLKILWISLSDQTQELFLMDTWNALLSKNIHLKEYSFIPTITALSQLKIIHKMFQHTAKYLINIEHITLELEFIEPVLKLFRERKDNSFKEGKKMMKEIVEMSLVNASGKQNPLCLSISCGVWMKNILQDMIHTAEKRVDWIVR